MTLEIWYSFLSILIGIFICVEAIAIITLICFWLVQPEQEKERIKAYFTHVNFYNGKPETPEKYKMVRFDTREMAENALSDMESILDTYGVVNAGDFYKLIGEETQFNDTKLKWTDLSLAEVVKTREGYFIEFPPLSRTR